MSTISRPAGAGPGGRTLARLGRHFTGGPAQAAWFVLDLLFVWQDRASQRHALRQLDDRMLKDIGLDRADIELEAAKPFWRA